MGVAFFEGAGSARVYNCYTTMIIIIIPFSPLVNYLIDEACNTGKGENTIISVMHHYWPSMD